jgi:PAS domain S-box-containing protein
LSIGLWKEIVTALMYSLAGDSRWFATTLSLEGVITSLSPGSEQFIGYSARELVGKLITHILSDSSISDVHQILATVDQGGHWEGEIVHRTREGKSLEARGTLSLLAGPEDNATGYLLFSSLHKPPVASPQADTAVAEVGERLRAFAHDLNNPLAIMMGFTQLLLVNSSCQGNLRSDVERLYSGLKRLIQVAENLHQYAISLHGKPGRAADG